eukprot:331822-Rhodomonas_salina.4
MRPSNRSRHIRPLHRHRHRQIQTSAGCRGGANAEESLGAERGAKAWRGLIKVRPEPRTKSGAAGEGKGSAAYSTFHQHSPQCATAPTRGDPGDSIAGQGTSRPPRTCSTSTAIDQAHANRQRNNHLARCQLLGVGRSCNT